MADFDVVFIDDEASLTDIFQHYVLMKYKDWRFTTFTSANLVYEQITKQDLKAAVWIVDMMMPGKNGAQIAEAIRSNHGNGPVVLAYTALDRDELYQHDEYRGGMHHFDRVVNKRSDLPDLLSLIDVWVTQSQVPV